MCTCDKCKKERIERNKMKTIQRQMALAANELDKLNAMLDRWPDKQLQLRGASDMLAEWEIGIESDFHT